MDQTQRSRLVKGNCSLFRRLDQLRTEHVHSAKGMQAHLSLPMSDWELAVERLAHLSRFQVDYQLVAGYTKQYGSLLQWQRHAHQVARSLARPLLRHPQLGQFWLSQWLSICRLQ